MVGVVKTQRFTYAPAHSRSIVFDRDGCNQHFIIQSTIAKEYLDHFQSPTEVDIYSDEDRLVWNGYTEDFVGDHNGAHLSLWPLLMKK